MKVLKEYGSIDIESFQPKSESNFDEQMATTKLNLGPIVCISHFTVAVSQLLTVMMQDEWVVDLIRHNELSPNSFLLNRNQTTITLITLYSYKIYL